MSADECKSIMVEIQENGIIRNETGVIIGRMCEHPEDIKDALDKAMQEMDRLRDALHVFHDTYENENGFLKPDQIGTIGLVTRETLVSHTKWRKESLGKKEA